MTTPVDVTYSDGTKSSGTGFFFWVFGPADPNIKGPQWRQIQKTYVITCRHVIQPDKFGSIETLSFSLRKKASDKIVWSPIEVKKSDLGQRLHLIRDSPVDVAAIDVSDLLEQAMRDATKSGVVALEAMEAVSSDNYPKVSPISVQSGDDLIVIGYPRLFTDDFNELPMVKRGLLITPWGLKFRGEDDFLIDFKGFDGESGSLVLSKPTDLVVQNGKLLTTNSKQFVFLGVYSGEPFIPGKMQDTGDEIIQEKIKVDTGQVWYWYTVQKTIDSPAFSK